MRESCSETTMQRLFLNCNGKLRKQERQGMGRTNVKVTSSRNI